MATLGEGCSSAVCGKSAQPDPIPVGGDRYVLTQEVAPAMLAASRGLDGTY